MAPLTSPGGRIATIQRFLKITHILDYLALLTTIALLYLVRRSTPFHTQFRLNDPRIAHPFAAQERVPHNMLLLLGCAVPAGTIALLLLLTRKSWRTLHAALIGLGLTIVTTDLLTTMAKNAIGRPRPDFLDRCMPVTKPGMDTGGDNWTDGTGVCTQTNDHKLQDGWRSFPSGHSSMAWAGLGYLGLVLAGQLHALRPGSNYLRMLVVLIPFVLAASIAVSRLEDYRHDGYDITAGSLLGLGVAYVNYRRYFPGLRRSACDELAFDRQDAMGGHRMMKLPDEELGNGAEEFEMDDSQNEEEERVPLSTRL